ncbi:TPA: hypothetical protein ACGO8N_000682 [Streptococcus suis]
MSELSDYFYNRVEKLFPGERCRRDWQVLELNQEFTIKSISTVYNQSKQKGVLPPIRCILAFDNCFTKDELKAFAEERMKDKIPYKSSLDYYYEFFGEEYKGPTCTSQADSISPPRIKRILNQLYLRRAIEIEAEGVDDQTENAI